MFIHWHYEVNQLSGNDIPVSLVQYCDLYTTYCLAIESFVLVRSWMGTWLCVWRTVLMHTLDFLFFWSHKAIVEHKKIIHESIVVSVFPVAFTYACGV